MFPKYLVFHIREFYIIEEWDKVILKVLIHSRVREGIPKLTVHFSFCHSNLSVKDALYGTMSFTLLKVK